MIEFFWIRRFYPLLIALDILANALVFGLFFGCRAYQTISSRCGESIKNKGWCYYVPWPKWWIEHCLEADYFAEV